MKPIVGLVDDFIEGIFNGSILTFYAEFINKEVDLVNPKLPAGVYGTEGRLSDTVAELLGKLINESIPKYLEDRDEPSAKEVFDRVLRLRMIGGIKNNPESLKELNFYKTRVTHLESQVTDKDTQITNLLKAIEAMKAGAGGIR